MSSRVWLTSEITPGSAARMVAEIGAVRGDLELVIDCIGGELDPAGDIGSALLRHKGATSALVIKADSAALVPMAACEDVTIASDGSMLLHLPAITVSKAFNERELGAVQGAMVQAKRDVAAILAKKSGSCERSYFEYLMNKNGGEGVRLDARSALSYGLVDSISPRTSDDLRLQRKASTGRLTDADVVDAGVRAGLKRQIEAMRAERAYRRLSNAIPAGGAPVARSRFHGFL
jgi:ATP-dependent protease ClpP protease subunit